MPTSQDDLLDRYLHAVQFWLPKSQQRDIIAELAEDLHSQLAERPLTDDEFVALLKKRGSPMRVAAGYLPEQRLINPALLPVYRLVLKIALLWSMLPLFVIVFAGPLLTSAHPADVILRFWTEAFRTVFTVIGIVTMVFALLDRYHVKLRPLDDWNPRKLPRVPVHPEIAARWNHLAGFIFGILAAIFWFYFLWQRTAFTFPGGPSIILGPIWKFVYWPILVTTLISASADLLAFLYPCWAQVRSRVRIAIDACMIITVAIVLRLGNWVEIDAPNLSPHDLTAVITWVNLSIQISLVATALIACLDAFMEIRRMHRLGSGPYLFSQRRRAAE
uniref:Transmembrane protein n=1 Tax=Solibacter usitatus (strain Ellin6076) TaxID=234267 RepID=Q029Z7_SOLUE